MKHYMELYEQKCGSYTIECDKDDGKYYIYSERFRAESLCTNEAQFQNFSQKIQELFDVTFGDPDVMKTYHNGMIKTKQEYENIVEQWSLRWSKGYPFSAFIIEDKKSDAVVGFEAIGNGSKINTGEVVYAFNKLYHNRSHTVGHESVRYEHVGYENVGALILGYGCKLKEYEVCVNQLYSEELQTFTNGSAFTKVEATARTDNIGSKKILENLGFKGIGIVNKYGSDRYQFELDYNNEESVVLSNVNEISQACSGLIQSMSSIQDTSGGILSKDCVNLYSSFKNEIIQQK